MMVISREKVVSGFVNGKFIYKYLEVFDLSPNGGISCRLVSE